MARPLAFVIPGLAMTLAACVTTEPQQQARLEPVISEARLETTEAAPGEPVQITYAVQYPGPWSDLQQVELVGLPRNALVRGEPPHLDLPADPASPGTVTLALPVPTLDGVHNLSLRVLTRQGAQTTRPLGPLTVKDVPGTIEQVSLEPNAHAIADCTGDNTRATLRYTVSDPNGAADVAEIRLLPIQPRVARLSMAGMPFRLRDRIPQVATGPALTITPAALVSPESSGDGEMVALTVEPPANGEVVAPTAGVALTPSSRYDLARDLVTTQIDISCKVSAPVAWRLRLVGFDRTRATPGHARQTNIATVDYLTNP